MFLPSGHSIASRVTEQISTVAQNDDSIHTPLVLSCNSTAQQETLLTTNLTDPLTSYASYLKELYTSMSQNCTSQDMSISDVEILGFTLRTPDRACSTLDGNSTHIQKLVQLSKSIVDRSDYCYVPLHVAILVHISHPDK